MFKFIVKTAIKVFFNIFYRIDIEGYENIPSNIGYIICSNHINLSDPLVIGISIKENIHFMAKKELFKFKPFGLFFRAVGGFPVDRDGNDISAIKTSFKLLKKGKAILIFAEGTRNKTNKPLLAKPGVAMIAIKSRIPILPITVDSTYKVFSKIKIIIHEPIYYSEFYGKKIENDEYQRLTQDIVNDIYKSITIKK
ncbi:lysophospholipid acyltransferase family protein [Helicovermis profundi]|uniref:Lysophospholipid acyltransferase family protein n=1 Tax=Helicovermis profundi TaxID=3065157 RepID=A0AAU9EVC2_9FIRM|nr:lysophospholipid acyltransferase family protein [Clostridia bacterium S502]